MHILWNILYEQGHYMGLQSWCPIFKSSDCNSFEDRAPVDGIYGCLIFKWVAETWLHDGVPGW